MNIEKVTLEFSRGDWNEIAKVVYRLDMIEHWMWQIHNCTESPYWLDQALWYYKHWLMDYIGQQLTPEVFWGDLDCSFDWVDVIHDVCAEFALKHNNDGIPLEINDSELDPFVDQLYDTLTNYCNELIEESAKLSLEDWSNNKE